MAPGQQKKWINEDRRLESETVLATGRKSEENCITQHLAITPIWSAKSDITMSHDSLGNSLISTVKAIGIGGVPSVIAPSTFFSIWFQWALAGDEGASVGLSNDSRQMESVVKDLKANYRSLEGPMMVKMKKKTLQLI